VACSVWLVAQTTIAEYRFDVWTAESGLPRDFLYDILQSREGYLWMSTLDGLVRFDGVRFTVFNKWNSPGYRPVRISSHRPTRDEADYCGRDTVRALV